MQLTVQVAAAALGRVIQAVIWKQMLFSAAKQPRAVVVGWPAALAGQPKQERKREAKTFLRLELRNEVAQRGRGCAITNFQ
jgi:RNase H-fold protein (predicted Holliday junction resolvase)